MTYRKKYPIFVIFGQFWALWRTPMAILYPANGPNPSSYVPAIWGAQGDLWSKIPNFHHFWALLGPLAPPHGHFVPGKWPKPIILDVSDPDPTMIHSERAIWGTQGDLWSKIPNFRHFWALWRPHMAISYPANGPNPSSWMNPIQIQP